MIVEILIWSFCFIGIATSLEWIADVVRDVRGRR